MKIMSQVFFPKSIAHKVFCLKYFYNIVAHIWIFVMYFLKEKISKILCVV